MMCLSDAHNKNATGECKWKTKTVTRASAAPIPLLLMLTNGAGLPAVYQRDAEAPASHPSAVFPRHCLHSGRGQTLPGSTVTRNHEFLTHADDAQFVSRGPPWPPTRQTSSSHRLYSPQSFFFFSPYVGSGGRQHMAHCTPLPHGYLLLSHQKQPIPPATFKGVGLCWPILLRCGRTEAELDTLSSI